MKKLTQAVFNDAPDWVNSAAVDEDGTAYLYESLSKDLGLGDKSGVFGHIAKGYNRSWIVVGEYDAVDWQNSAIDREDD